MAGLAPACFAQTKPAPAAGSPAAPAAPAKKAVTPSKSTPNAQEVFGYIRAKLLSLSPEDGFNDNVDVVLDATSTVMTTTQPGGHCDQFLSALDTNSLSWDTFDSSDRHNSGEALLRLTITSQAGKAGRACFKKDGRVEEGVSTNRVRLLFALSKAQEIPGFQEKMGKAVRRLITLAGGLPEKKLF
jgi:hypothetical protein